jgi:plasmid replication initiation protein
MSLPTQKARQKPPVLKTPQSIIHIKHNITLRQYKYWVLLLRFYREIFEAGEQSEEDGFYRIAVSKIEAYIGYEPVKSELKSDFEALRKQPIIINFLNKDKQKSQQGMGFISEWEITSKTIAFKIPSFLEAVVRGDEEAAKIFHQLNWSIFNSFNGKYEAIIYKLCKDYVGIGRTPYMTVTEYREYVGLKEDEYTSMDDFNKRCIKNPVALINKNEISDIDVSVDYKRAGRKVEGLYFKVTERKQARLPFPEFEPSPAFALAKIAISLEDQTKYLEGMTENEVKATILRANEYSESLKVQGKKAQIGAIYHKAFAERWGVQHLEQQKNEEVERVEQTEVDKQKRYQAQAGQTADEVLKQITQRAFEWYETLSEQEKIGMIEAYIHSTSEIIRPTTQQMYKKFGVNAPKDSPQFKGLFAGFLREKFNISCSYIS